MATWSVGLRGRAACLGSVLALRCKTMKSWVIFPKHENGSPNQVCLIYHIRVGNMQLSRGELLFHKALDIYLLLLIQ